jgi:hypothetical protein
MTWRKSSYSDAGGENCVEVGGASGVVSVRDTKQASQGDARTVLTVTPGVWESFTASLR